MSDTIELLNEIVRSAQTGRNTLLQLRDVTANDSFRSSLEIQQREYARILAQAGARLEGAGQSVQVQTNMTRMGTYMSIKMKTAGDKSTRNLSEMLLQGGGKGVIALTKALRDFPQAAADVRSLAQRLIDVEERNIEELKNFL